MSTQKDIILHNEKEIAQLKVQNEGLKEKNEGLSEGLSEGLNEGLKAKKRWQKATLYSVVLNVTFLGSLYVLSR